VNVENIELIESKKGMTILKNINLDIKNGELIGIIGGVGSGKTSLLYSILNEMNKEEGSIRINRNNKIGLIS